MDSKVVNLFKRPWNKLEFKFKKTKIEEYFEDRYKNNEITFEEKTCEIDKHLKLIKLNKVKIIYDVDSCFIKEIKQNK